MFSKGGQLPGLVRRGDIRIVRRIQVFINRQRISQKETSNYLAFSAGI